MRTHGKISSETRKMISAQIANASGANREFPCPRCGQPCRQLVATLVGPARGSRCFDCWEAEP